MSKRDVPEFTQEIQNVFSITNLDIEVLTPDCYILKFRGMEMFLAIINGKFTCRAKGEVEEKFESDSLSFQDKYLKWIQCREDGT